MDENMEERLNTIGSQIRIIETLIRAVETSLFGVAELEDKDAGCIFSVLREKVNELKLDYNVIIKDLHI